MQETDERTPESPRRRGKCRLWIADQVIQPIPPDLSARQLAPPDWSPEEWRNYQRVLRLIDEHRDSRRAS